MGLVGLALLAAVGCEQQSLGSQSSPAVSGSRAASQSPAPVVAICRLPVVSWYQVGPPGSVHLPSFGVQAHYVSYADGGVSVVPTDEFTNVEDGFGWRSAAEPALRGTGPVGYYDAALKRFLPVPRAQVSPDGRRYAYMDYTQGGLFAFGQLHVVDVASGRDRTLNMPAAEYQIYDFSADGIYFSYGPYALSAGLWLLDPDTGVAHQVFKDGYVLAVDNGVAWFAVNQNDPHATSPLPGGEGGAIGPILNVLLRRDLKSGQDTEMLRRPLTASAFELLGVYSGAAVVVLYSADSYKDPRWSTGEVPYEVWRVSRPSVFEKVSAGVNRDVQTDPWYLTGRNGLGISDSRGIWLGGDAIYLYQQGAGLKKIAAFPGHPANGCT